ncbi:MAG: hypothetical protein QXT63_07470, partial [Thermoplasmata archaeon]
MAVYMLVGMIAMTAFSALLPDFSATTPNSISCNGDSLDWAEDEKCGERNGTKFYVTWNTTHIFFAWNGTNLDGEGDLFIYLNTTNGGNNQTTDWSGTHNLPYLADYVYCVENVGYYAIRSASTNWGDMGITLPSPYIGHSNNRLTEVAISRDSIGNPSWVDVVAFVQEETSSKVLVSYPTKNAIGHVSQNFTAYYSFRLIDGYSPASMAGIIDLDNVLPNIIGLDYNSTPTENMQIYINYSITEIGGGLNNTFVRYTTNNWVSFTDAVGECISGDYFSGAYSVSIGSYSAGTLIEFAVLAKDFSGNEFWLNNNSQNYKIQVIAGSEGDTTGPSITNVLINPVNPSPSDIVNITAEITDASSGVKNASVRWTSNNWQTFQDSEMANSVGNTWFVNLGSFSAGTTVEFALYAYDNAGNLAWNNNGSMNYHFTVSSADNLAPSITSTMHEPSSPLVGQAINITTVVTDNVAVSAVYLHWTTDNWAHVFDTPMNLSSNNVYYIKIGPFAAGTNVKYVIHAFDTSNNEAWDNNQGADYQFTVTSQDSIPPTIENTTHKPSNPTSTDQVYVECNVYDNSGLANVNIIWTTNNWATVNANAMTNIDGSLYRYVLGNFVSGTTIFYCVNATDVYGNVRWDNNYGQNYRIDVGLDVSPPVIGAPSHQPSSPVSGEQITIFANVTDDNSVASVFVRYTTNNWSSYIDVVMENIGENLYSANIGSFV